MAEDAFERFRRLRKLATQEGAAGPVVQEAVLIEDGRLVDDDQPPMEMEREDRPEIMTPLALLRTLHAHGVTMTPYPGGKVRCHAPQGAWTLVLLEALNRHQADVTDLLETFEERAGIAEYCGGLSRREAEHLAWQCVLGETPA
jgi:hypothetical protein